MVGRRQRHRKVHVVQREYRGEARTRRVGSRRADRHRVQRHQRLCDSFTRHGAFYFRQRGRDDFRVVRRDAGLRRRRQLGERRGVQRPGDRPRRNEFFHLRIELPRRHGGRVRLHVRVRDRPRRVPRPNDSRRLRAVWHSESGRDYLCDVRTAKRDGARRCRRRGTRVCERIRHGGHPASPRRVARIPQFAVGPRAGSRKLWKIQR